MYLSLTSPVLVWKWLFKTLYFPPVSFRQTRWWLVRRSALPTWRSSWKNSRRNVQRWTKSTEKLWSASKSSILRWRRNWPNTFLFKTFFNNAGFVPCSVASDLNWGSFGKLKLIIKRRISSTDLVYRKKKFAYFQLKCLFMLFWFRAGGMPVFVCWKVELKTVWLHQLRD